MTGLFVILVLVLAVLYFNDAWRSLERVRAVARGACERAGVQFLDGSVVQTGLRVEYADGRLHLVRRYRFEFATDGSRRYGGEISLRGRRIRVISMDLPEGGRVLDPDSPTPGPGGDAW